MPHSNVGARPFGGSGRETFNVLLPNEATEAQRMRDVKEERIAA